MVGNHILKFSKAFFSFFYNIEKYLPMYFSFQSLYMFFMMVYFVILIKFDCQFLDFGGNSFIWQTVNIAKYPDITQLLRNHLSSCSAMPLLFLKKSEQNLPLCRQLERRTRKACYRRKLVDIITSMQHFICV